MYSYSTNCMIPINMKWLEENGDQWAGGRIDIHGGPSMQEFSMPIMAMGDWIELQNFCDNFRTRVQYDFSKFIKKFEEYLNRNVRWFELN